MLRNICRQIRQSTTVHRELLCYYSTSRPPVVALALGSVLLGTVQTGTFKNCGQKEMKWQSSKITQHTLCICLLILRVGAGAVVWLLRSSSPWNGGVQVCFVSCPRGCRAESPAPAWGCAGWPPPPVGTRCSCCGCRASQATQGEPCTSRCTNELVIKSRNKLWAHFSSHPIPQYYSII